MVWMPTKCCCGASIRTGALIIGWLYLIGTALHAVSLLKFTFLSYDDLTQICRNVSTQMEASIDPHACANTVIGYLIFAAVGSGIGLLFSTLLLVGVNKNRPMFMLPFIAMQGAGAAIAGILVLLVFALFLYVNMYIGAFTWFLIAGGIIWLDFYLLMVVIACYKEVKQHREGMIGDSSVAYVEQKDHLFNYKI